MRLRTGLAGIGRSRRYGPRRIPAVPGAVIAAVIVAVAVTVAVVLGSGPGGRSPAGPGVSQPGALANGPQRYLGIYVPPSPESYTGVSAFTTATGVRPALVLYYSGWMEQFQSGFAAAAARHHAVPLIQIDPSGVSLRAIASGQYDAYLRSYAAAVREFGGRVVLSFGHEMNGHWYSWGYTHTQAATFVAAWRHIVTVFRRAGADNVTWLWTVNIIDAKGGIPSPAAWWPGSSYVTWVGIDGYYHKSSWKFDPLFGPTIKAVRALTIAPILISETGAPAADAQPAKIADLFAGVRAYGLLGFVWFDVNKYRDWRISSPAAIAAYRHGAQSYSEPAS